MDNTECVIAIYHTVNDNSNSINIVDFFKILALDVNLTEDAVNGFYT